MQIVHLFIQYKLYPVKENPVQLQSRNDFKAFLEQDIDYLPFSKMQLFDSLRHPVSHVLTMFVFTVSTYNLYLFMLHTFIHRFICTWIPMKNPKLKIT